jgi:ParB family chromosome partitioning protein
MESLKRYGLMNPVVVNSDKELIAGHRRLESARRLGWSTITVRVVDKEDELTEIEMEIDENTQRKNLTTDELADAYLRLDKMRNPGFFRRIWLAIKRLFTRKSRKS